MITLQHRLILLVAATAAVVCGPAFAKRGVTPEDYYAFEFASDAHIAPDGRQIAYVVTAIDQKSNPRNSSIWLVSTNESSAPRRLTADGSNANAPCWSPDGSRLDFFRIATRGQTRGHTTWAHAPKCRVLKSTCSGWTEARCKR